MKRVIEIIEVLGVVRTPQGDRDVCFSADAEFDEHEGVLTAKLDAFLRPIGSSAKSQAVSTVWLPKAESVHASARADELGDVAKDIVRWWACKVRLATVGAASVRPDVVILPADARRIPNPIPAEMWGASCGPRQ
jgi:hypothetical protein